MKKLFLSLFLASFALIGLSQTQTFQIEAYVDQNISCYGNKDGFIVAKPVNTNSNPLPGLTYYLYNESDSLVASNTHGFFLKLDRGYYHIIAKTLTSQSDPVNDLYVLEPDPLNVEWFVIEHPTPRDASNGALGINITGGTANLQPYLTFWIDGFSGNILNDMLTDNFATNLQGLPYGTYQVTIEDDNGCFFVSEYYFSD